MGISGFYVVSQFLHLATQRTSVDRPTYESMYTHANDFLGMHWEKVITCAARVCMRKEVQVLCYKLLHEHGFSLPCSTHYLAPTHTWVLRCQACHRMSGLEACWNWRHVQHSLVFGSFSVQKLADFAQVKASFGHYVNVEKYALWGMYAPALLGPHGFNLSGDRITLGKCVAAFRITWCDWMVTVLQFLRRWLCWSFILINCVWA